MKGESSFLIERNVDSLTEPRIGLQDGAHDKAWAKPSSSQVGKYLPFFISLIKAWTSSCFKIFSDF